MAVCTVTVVGYPIAGYNYNNYPTSIAPIGSLYPTVTVTPSYIPRLPNTGFAPMDAASFAIAFALMLAAALAAYPYARKALAITLR